MKQAGSVLAREWRCRDPKGEQHMEEWPAAFQVRQMPTLGEAPKVSMQPLQGTLF
jgi:hypothetical protein